MIKVEKGIKERVEDLFPLNSEKVYLNSLSIDMLLCLKDTIDQDVLRTMTCRPVKSRNRNESIELYKKHKLDKTMSLVGIFEVQTNRLLGKITVFDYNYRNQSVEIGYYIKQEYRKKGYTKESLRLICEVLFDKLNINKISAQTGVFNEASRSLLEGLGFKVDGILREHHELDGILYDDYIYSILRCEFLSSSKN